MRRDFEVADAVDMTQELVSEAGQIALSMFGLAEGRKKADGTLVTEADGVVEKFIRSRILDRFPEHTVYGEEGGSSGAEQSSFLWLVDPIDGTNNFAFGVPIWGVSVGLFHNGQPCLGALHMPCLGQTFWALDGGGAYCNGEPVTVRQGNGLERNDLLLVSSPDIPHWDFLVPVKYRITGSAAYSMALVAAGKAIGMVCTHWHVWDAGAGMPLLKEAGAVMTDAHGRSLFDLRQWDYTAAGPCMVTASADYHAALMCHVTAL